MKKLILVLTIFLLNSCAVQPPQQTQETTSGPAAELMAQADQQAENGENAQAIALLERAVHIEPRNGYAWLHLAKLHFDSGDLNKAEQFALKATQFAGGDKVLEQECQEFLDKVRLQLKQRS